MSSQSFLAKIQGLPLGHRYAIVTFGSLFLFSLIVWGWIGQVRSQIVILSSPAAHMASPALSQEKSSDDILKELGDTMGILKDQGTAAFSALGGNSEDKENISATNPPPTGVKEGDELDQYLFYEPFPSN